MFRAGFKFLSVIALATSIAAACSEYAPTATSIDPASEIAAAKRTSGPSGAFAGDTAVVLRRLTPIQQHSATQRIGKQGGIIEIPEAGIRVVFPANGLVPPSKQKWVDITVTAVEGSEVSYKMEPHGLTFRLPVQVYQDLKETTAFKDRWLMDTLEGAYHVDPILDGTVFSPEFRPTQVDVTGNKAKFTIDHFSGYILAQGRK